MSGVLVHGLFFLKKFCNSICQRCFSGRVKILVQSGKWSWNGIFEKMLLVIEKMRKFQNYVFFDVTVIKRSILKFWTFWVVYRAFDLKFACFVAIINKLSTIKIFKSVFPKLNLFLHFGDLLGNLYTLFAARYIK